jgi:hypothetical protein
LLGQACRVGDRQWIELLLEPEARAKRRASYEAVRLYGAKRSEQDRVVRKKAKRASRDRRSLVRAKEAKMREQAMLLEELGRDRKDKLIRKIVNSALIELITAEEATEGQTPFHLACEFGHIDIVRYLASILRKSFVIPFVLPFVINYTDYRGWTPLHCAARFLSSNSHWECERRPKPRLFSFVFFCLLAVWATWTSVRCFWTRTPTHQLWRT